MSNNIIISSDSTCDLSPELRERYNVSIIPLGVTLGDKTYFVHRRNTGNRIAI